MSGEGRSASHVGADRVRCTGDNLTGSSEALWRRRRRERTGRDYHMSTASCERPEALAPALDGLRPPLSPDRSAPGLLLSYPSPAYNHHSSSHPSYRPPPPSPPPNLSMQVPVHPSSFVIGQPINPISWPRKLPKPSHISVNVRVATSTACRTSYWQRTAVRGQARHVVASYQPARSL